MLRLKNPRGNETSPTTSPPPATTQQKFPPGMKVQERDQPVGKLESRSGSLPVGVPPHSSQSSFRSCHPPPSHLTHSNRSHSTHSHSTHSHSTHSHSSHSRSSHSHSHSKSSQSHSSPPSPYSSYSPVALSPVRPVNCIPQGSFSFFFFFFLFLSSPFFVGRDLLSYCVFGLILSFSFFFFLSFILSLSLFTSSPFFLLMGTF